MQYKLSVFNHYFTTVDNKVGIFNTLTGAIIGVDTEEYNLLLNVGDVEIPSDKEHIYISNGFLVPYTLNEYEEIHIQRIKSILEQKQSVYRILTTLDCNARCFYCYEGCNNNPLYMGQKEADQVVKFITEHVQDRQCLIQWFGGEPLMNINVIDSISSHVINELGNDRVHSMIVTNGSLINDAIISKMVNQWNVRRVQITLDGAASVYTLRKNYVNIKNPFATVISNIENILKTDIHVIIRLNYDSNNYHDMSILLEFLREEFGNKTNLSVYAERLFGNDRGIVSINDTAKKEWFYMQNALINNGFIKPLDAFALPRIKFKCFACSSRSFVILPNGDLFKCTLSMNDEAAKVGDIWHGIFDYSNLEKWCCTSLEEDCLQCKFVPICMGGCRAGFLNYCSESCFIKKGFVDDILRERLKYLAMAQNNF